MLRRAVRHPGPRRRTQLHLRYQGDLGRAASASQALDSWAACPLGLFSLSSISNGQSMTSSTPPAAKLACQACRQTVQTEQ